MMDCIFCKITKKEIPSSAVLENDSLIAVKDINPQAPVHILIIPKKHYSTLLECKDKGLFGDMLSMANEIAKKLGVEKKGFRVTVNTNNEGGQTMFHLHMHLLAGRPLSGIMG
ncbi:MAG: histidine triad nucleotide-binding protein [Deltaproteobacteria bacterium]|nr:histidine triad nucleotide-binding protein [Deltaproteobacteria bacterium]